MSSAPQTMSTDLLSRVRARQPEAWERFAAVYTPLVYGWCRRGGLREEDAADVVQEVFRHVLRGVDQFRRENGGNFRGWLWTITRNEIRGHFRRRQDRPQAAGGTDIQRRLEQAPEILSEDEPSGPDGQLRLLQRALQSIRQDFAGPTWEAFQRVVLQGRSAQETADELGMQPAAVRQAKYRVLCRLREEMVDGPPATA